MIPKPSQAPQYRRAKYEQISRLNRPISIRGEVARGPVHYRLKISRDAEIKCHTWGELIDEIRRRRLTKPEAFYGLLPVHPEQIAAALGGKL